MSVPPTYIQSGQSPTLYVNLWYQELVLIGLCKVRKVSVQYDFQHYMYQFIDMQKFLHMKYTAKNTLDISCPILVLLGSVPQDYKQKRCLFPQCSIKVKF